MIVEYRLEGKRKMRIFLTLLTVVAYHKRIPGLYGGDSEKSVGYIEDFAEVYPCGARQRDAQEPSARYVGKDSGD